MKHPQVPPPVYRPVSGPVQQKPDQVRNVGPRPLLPVQDQLRPAAPPVYRPQAAGAQLKTAAGTRAGAAPPVYRPQAAGAQLKTAAGARAGTAPPVYRPQAAGAQLKTAAGVRAGAAPPVYRPQPAGAQLKTGAGARAGTAPPVYRPQAAGAQLKTAVAAVPRAVLGPRQQHRGGPIQRMYSDPYWQHPLDFSWSTQPIVTSWDTPPYQFNSLLQDDFPVVVYEAPQPDWNFSQTPPSHILSSYDEMEEESREFGETHDLLNDLFPELQQETWVPLGYDDEFEEEFRKYLESFGTPSAMVSKSNTFTWEVKSKASYQVADSNVQSVLTSFGDPTTDVVKKYDDLASRVRHDVDQNKGVLLKTTSDDLDLFFEATTPLHFQFNPYLYNAWTGNLDNYSGAKKEIALYSVMRSQLTNNLRQIALGSGTLDSVLKEVSGRPAEVHHLLYKAKRPKLADHTGNLVLSQRSQREKEFGPGQHELMHMVSSGKHSNKFDVLLDVYETQYKDFMKRKGILI
jgi:hypothetical protein